MIFSPLGHKILQIMFIVMIRKKGTIKIKVGVLVPESDHNRMSDTCENTLFILNVCIYVRDRSRKQKIAWCLKTYINREERE